MKLPQHGVLFLMVIRSARALSVYRTNGSMEHKLIRLSRITIGPVYSAELLDDFQNPRNGGALEAPDRSAQLENPACGDILELTLKLEGDRIAEIRFRAKGCLPAMACGSAVTELAKGKTIQEAKQISREELVTALGTLPQASAHASHLAMDTLAALLRGL